MVHQSRLSAPSDVWRGARVAGPRGEASRLPRDRNRGAPLLDTRLRKESFSDVKHLGRPDKVFRDRRAGKLWSRVRLGLYFPGSYYFLTFTSSKKSPPLEKSWKKLRWWLSRNYPDIQWVYCITEEGLGVIHMIVRRAKGRKFIKKPIAEYWQKTHKAFMDLRRVKNKKGLADYLADQRHKSDIATEMFNQPSLVRYRCGTGWVPKGYMKIFGRFWHNFRDVPPLVRDQVLREWLFAIDDDIKNIEKVPYINRDGVLIR